MFRTTRLLPVFAVAAALALPRTALATPNFPGILQQELGLAAAPPCSVCHAGGVTGRGTVTTPFGSAMRSRGLVAYDPEAPKKALAALTAENTDSDADGVTDIEELKKGTDPNVNLEEPPPAPPEFGCSAVRQAHAPSWLAIAVATLFAMTTIARRRR